MARHRKMRKKVRTLPFEYTNGKRRGVIIRKRQKFLSELASAHSDVLQDENSGSRKGFSLFNSRNEDEYYDDSYGLDEGHTVQLSDEESDYLRGESTPNAFTRSLSGVKGAVGSFFSNFKRTKRRKSAREEYEDRYEGYGMFVPRNRPPRKGLAIAATTLKTFIIALLVVCFIGGGALMGVAQSYIDTAPALDMETIKETSLTSNIYDVNGELIATYSGVENRTWADITEIPELMTNAIIAVEDIRFYDHNGIDVKRIAGSFVRNMTSSSVEGGSTITQQVIKNNMLSSERSYRRKLQEAKLALQLEEISSKDKILETYINDVSYGEQNYGIKNAATDYFHKELDQLTLRECAMLAGTINNPTIYNPRRNYYVRNTPEKTDARTDLVLERMYRAGYITLEQYEQAKNEKVHIYPERTSTQSVSDYPSFVEYVIVDVRNMLLKKRGLEDTEANRKEIDNELKTGGLQIYTTLDPDLQNKLQDTIYEWKRYPSMRYSADRTTRETLSDGTVIETIQPQTAACVIDWRTGEIKGIVGSRTKPEQTGMLNRAYQSQMPVGSSIKPIAVYAPAIDHAGMGTSSPIQNIEGPIEGWIAKNGKEGSPSQTGTKGPVTMEKAIVNSLNVSAARTLMEYIDTTPERGIAVSKKYLMEMGVEESHIQETGAGLALGTSGINMVEMAGAFSVLANKGKYVQPVSFLRVEDSNGKLILDAKEEREERQVLKEGTSWMMIDMMTKAVQSGTGTAARISGVQVAGKTGTNDDHRGVTFAGVTPYYAAAVWIGHDDYKPLSRVYASRSAAPLWQSFMSKFHEGKTDSNKKIIEESPEQLGLVEARVCGVSGMKAGGSCGSDGSGFTPSTGWFLAGTEPTETCTWHKTATLCSETGMRPTEFCPTASRSYVSFPEGDKIRNIGMDILRSVYRGSPSGSTCNVHTAEWKAAEDKKKEDANKDIVDTGGDVEAVPDSED